MTIKIKESGDLYMDGITGLANSDNQDVQSAVLDLAKEVIKSGSKVYIVEEDTDGIKRIYSKLEDLEDLQDLFDYEDYDE